MRTIFAPITIAVVCLFIGAGWWSRPGEDVVTARVDLPREAPMELAVPEPDKSVLEVPLADPDPMTYAEPIENARIAQLVYAFLKAHLDEGAWVACGERLDPRTWEARAIPIAQGLYAAEVVYGLHAGKGLATIWQESRGDPCAIGPHARARAVKEGWVKPRKGMKFSYSYLESLEIARKTLEHQRPVAMGLCQIVYPLFRHGEVHIEDLLTAEGGLRYCLTHAKWLQQYTGESPWHLWRGMSPTLIMKRVGTLDRWQWRYLKGE